VACRVLKRLSAPFSLSSSSSASVECDGFHDFLR
jgi:hypothetical protein